MKLIPKYQWGVLGLKEYAPESYVYDPRTSGGSVRIDMTGVNRNSPGYFVDTTN